MSSPRRVARALTCSLAVAVLTATGTTAAVASPSDVPGTAGAETLTGVPEAARPAFYEPPARIPDVAGTVIRSEQADTVADPLKVHDRNFTHRRVMYATRDRDGVPVAATGLVIVPKAKWLGPGKRRPLIVHAPGTQGGADRCASSRRFQKFNQYEILFMKDLLLRGYAIAVPDYQGLGTPGSHTYMVREAQAHAVLDMARAVQRMEIPGIDKGTPVGLNGYSQGGGSAAAAVELAPQYAPELDIKGAAVGAAPADLDAVARKIDGTRYTSFELYATIGLLTAHHLDTKQFFTEKGIATLEAAEDSCTSDLGAFSNLDTSTLTRSGRKIPAYFREEPLKSVAAANRVGGLKPKAPVLVTHSRMDDVIPYSVGTQLAQDWCDLGADVQFRTHLDAAHALGASTHAIAAQLWFEGRFAGRKQTSTCKVH